MLRQGRLESVGRSSGILRLRRCAGIASRVSFRPVCPPLGQRTRKTRRGGRFSAIRNVARPKRRIPIGNPGEGSFGLPRRRTSDGALAAAIWHA